MFSALRRIRSSSFVTRAHPLSTATEIIWWWESRRLAFNVVVGATGVVTFLGLVAVLAIGLQFPAVAAADFPLPDPPIFMAAFGVLAFGIMANVCYTGGWIVELLVKWVWPEESNQLATLTFTLGLLVAVLVTLLPIPLFGGLLILIAVFG